MRLLKYDDRGNLSLTKDLQEKEIPPYAILSHTWGDDEDEVKLQELDQGPDQNKSGFKKLQLCGGQAKQDRLDHFWVDTCCIDKNSSQDVSVNINSMFRYYRNSSKCYVYLSDVHVPDSMEQFRQSRWFKRGWTLQELLAPSTIEFYSSTWEHIGSKVTLKQEIHNATQIPLDALGGTDWDHFSTREKMSWAAGRETKIPEDEAYCLLGIFGVVMYLLYSEGKSQALARLQDEIGKRTKPTLHDVDTRIEEYYLTSGRLDIERLSGQRLAMDACFVNLGIANRSVDGDATARDIDSDEEQFSNEGFWREDEFDSEGEKLVSLEKLFKPRKLLQGTVDRPKHILICGQAGMGKTTLSKKIVHEFIRKRLWRGLFDRVLWLPLRRLTLRPNEAMSVAQMVREICLHGASDDAFPFDVLGRALVDIGNRSLFILDGLDEVSRVFDPDSPMGANLEKLLKQDNMIITSRPHSTSVFQQLSLDLKLEIVGFSSKQIARFLRTESEVGSIDTDAVPAILSFIQQRPRVRGLAQIPVLLDAICYTWNRIDPEQDMTVTSLFQAVSNQIWRKDVVRLGKKINGESIIPQQIPNWMDVRSLVEAEASYLEELAFIGLCNGLVEFGPEIIHIVAKGLLPLPENQVSKLSFLRSSDNSPESAYYTKHFIHLSLQEFWAARYFVSHWSSSTAMHVPRFASASAKFASNEDQIMPDVFVQRQKYNNDYGIFWRFVTGLLQTNQREGTLSRFFTQLENEPHDQLGVVHQWLVVHCLNEIEGDQDVLLQKPQELIRDYQKWIAFESKTWNSTRFLEKTECPSCILEYLVWGTRAQKINVMGVLRNKSHVSLKLLEMALEQAQHADDQEIRRQALAVVCIYCDQLPQGRISNLFAALTTDSWSKIEPLVRYRKLGKSLVTYAAQFMPNSPTSTMARKRPPSIFRIGESSDVRSDVMKVLKKQSRLRQTAIDSLVYFICDKNSDFRWYTDYNVDLRHDIPKGTVNDLISLLDDASEEVQICAARYLCAHRHLPETVTIILIQSLNNDRSGSQHRRHILDVLRAQEMSERFIDVFINCLNDSDPTISRRAANALEELDNLPEDVVMSLINRTRDHHPIVQMSVFDALNCQPYLTERAIETLVDLWPQNELYYELRTREDFLHRTEFLQFIKISSIESLTKILRILLEGCILYGRHNYAVFRDTRLLLEINSMRSTISFEDGELKPFKQRWHAAQKALEVPLKGDNSNTSHPDLKRKITGSEQDERRRTAPK